MRTAILSTGVLLALASCSSATEHGYASPPSTRFEDFEASACHSIPQAPAGGDMAEYGTPQACSAHYETPDGRSWSATCDQASLTCECSYGGRVVCSCDQVPVAAPYQQGCPHTCCPGAVGPN